LSNRAKPSLSIRGIGSGRSSNGDDRAQRRDDGVTRVDLAHLVRRSELGHWNGDIERITISGPFAADSTIAMTPVGQETVELRIAEASEPNLFVDEAEMDDVVIRTIHRIDPLDDERNRVTYRLEISGPAADSVGPELGPEISGDFPETLAALVEKAEA